MEPGTLPPKKMSLQMKVAIGIVAVIVAFVVLGKIGSPTRTPPRSATSSAGSQEVSVACRFKWAVWGSVVEKTASDLHSWHGYLSEQEAKNDTDPLSEAYDRAEAAYGFPAGSTTLGAALSDTWSHLWDATYWDRLYVNSLSSLSDDTGSFDKSQRAEAFSQGQDSMSAAWTAVNGICPNH